MINVASNQILPPQITGYKTINPYPSPNSDGRSGQVQVDACCGGLPERVDTHSGLPEQPAVPCRGDRASSRTSQWPA